MASEQETIKQEPIEKLNVNVNTWNGMLKTFPIWGVKDPWTFLGYVAIIYLYFGTHAPDFCMFVLKISQSH